MSTFIVFLIFGIFNFSNCQTAGAPEDANPNEFTGSAWKAVAKINEKNNGPYYLVPIKVLKAQVQVVAGTNTILQVLVGQSNCPISNNISGINQSNCQYNSGGSRSIYQVEIWDKPWENFEQITVKKVRDVNANEKF